MSDWPLSLLLDELWLRSRRLTVHRLERSGFWPDSAQYWPCIGELIELGQGIDQRCLQARLSAAEYAYLHSEQAFGSPRNAFGRRWPLILAFGHQVTDLFAACHGAQRGIDAVADVGACFNLGISLIDLVLDESAFKSTAETVISILAEYNVKKLLEPRHWAAFDDQLVRVPLGDARVLLRIVSAVYKGMAQLDFTPDSREELGALLEDAFRAEIASTRPGMRSKAQQEKSILPFQVMACIARSTGTADESRATRHREMARQLGGAIALLDDLCDLVDDLRAGAINSIAGRPAKARPGSASVDTEERAGVDAFFTVPQTVDDSAGAASALSMLEGNELADAVEALIDQLREAESLALSLAAPGSQALVQARLASIRAFVRNWLE